MSSTDRPDNETTSSAADQRLLNTYIYDYLVKQSCSATALAFKKEVDIPTISEEEARKRRASDDNPEGSLEKNLDASSQQKEAASRLNGTDDVDIASNSDTSSKNAPADVPIDLEGGFLVEWWTVFWDMFAARQGRPSSSNAASFIAHSQVFAFVEFALTIAALESRTTKWSFRDGSSKWWQRITTRWYSTISISSGPPSHA